MANLALQKTKNPLWKLCVFESLWQDWLTISSLDIHHSVLDSTRMNVERRISNGEFRKVLTPITAQVKCMNILHREGAVIRERYRWVCITIMVNGLVVYYIEIISILPVITQSEIDRTHIG